jgi:hypothetical protein
MRKLAVAALLASSLAGCDSSTGPPPPPPPPPFQYPAPNSPGSALLIYKYAWELKDTVQVASILADDYQGSSTDQGDGITLTFTKADEVRALGGLTRDASVISVDVELGSPSTWHRFTYSSDPAGWATLLVANPRISMSRTLDEFMTGSSNTMEFTFRPVSIAGTDTTWSLVRWSEIQLP